MPKRDVLEMVGLLVLVGAVIAVSASEWSARSSERDAAFAACSGYRIEGHDGWGQVRLCVTEVPRGHP